jgi:hypothetical protein
MTSTLKIQCPSCKEIVDMNDFSTSSEGLRFCCPACGQQHFLENPTKEPPTAVGPDTTEPAPGQIVCPKCGHSQEKGEACHRCGLMFARWDPANQPAPPLQAENLWAEIERQPHDVDLHEQFVQACHAADRLDYATRQYRILEKRPDLKAVIERMQQRIFSLAQSRIVPMTHDDPGADKKRQLMRLLLWVLLAASIAAFAYLLMDQANSLGQ